MPDPTDSGNDIIMGFLRDIKNPDGTPDLFIYSTAANNHGDNNKYWSPSPEGSTSLRYVWTTGNKYVTDFNSTPAEENGTFLTDTEKNQILQTAGIPLTPLPH